MQDQNISDFTHKMKNYKQCKNISDFTQEMEFGADPISKRNAERVGKPNAIDGPNLEASQRREWESK